jgi:ATP-dependent Clp protease adaptor protein ClpS
LAWFSYKAYPRAVIFTVVREIDGVVKSTRRTLEKSMPIAGGSTETVPKRRTERKVTTEPPYKVILHNDDYTPMEHVIKALRKVIPRMNLKRAVSIMLEAHTKGQAVVTKCHKELAELYQEGLKSEGLLATIEPD